jgi:signal transduction histidine kinase
MKRKSFRSRRADPAPPRAGSPPPEAGETARKPSSFPPTSFWKPEDEGALWLDRRDTEARAHKEALVALDRQLEVMRAQPQPRPKPVLRYFLYFFLFLLLLSYRDINVSYREAGDLLSLQRLYPKDYGDVPPARVREELARSAMELAPELNLPPEEVLGAQEAAEKKRRHRFGVLDWGLVLQFGDVAILFNYGIFLNMLYAAGLASVLFLRNREMTQSKLIDRQNRELSILNERQSLEMKETSRLVRVLSRAQSRLLAAEKLASIGRLSATLAHEIRNPLGIIASSVGMVAEDVNPQSSSGQALDLVRHEIDRLNKIITDLLDFARPQVPNPDYIDVNDLVREWTGPLADEFTEKHVRLLADLDPAPPEVFIDADQLYQAVLNLILNAAEALEEVGGGDINLTTRTESPDIVALEVRDTADGIASEVLQQVFEPFFTTKTSGSGLGLAVVKQTIEAMGGTVNIESTLGKGTTVRLRLPTGPHAAAGSSLAEEESTGEPSHPETPGSSASPDSETHGDMLRPGRADYSI